MRIFLPMRRMAPVLGFLGIKDTLLIIPSLSTSHGEIPSFPKLNVASRLAFGENCTKNIVEPYFERYSGIMRISALRREGTDQNLKKTCLCPCGENATAVNPSQCATTGVSQLHGCLAHKKQPPS